MDLSRFDIEAMQLIALFDAWWSSNHLKAIQKSDEFWLKYNKSYNELTTLQKEQFISIGFEGTYRKKYLSSREEIIYEKWLDKLIPDNYFD
jgi:uroporphyrinogen-III decarboxylase